MKYTPLQDFLVVEMEEHQTESKHGILLPQSVREDRLPARVLAVGPGRREKEELVPIDGITVGDRVIFNKFSALELNERDRLYLVRASDIGCKIND